ncbi:MAG: glutamine synthetase family protein [Massilia sp.]
MSFVTQFDLWSSEQHAAADDVVKALRSGDIGVVRFSFADQHGILRGKTLVASEAIRALHAGVSLTSTLFAKDTAHKTVFPVFEKGGGFDMPEMQGCADTVMVADPTTFRVLPWAPHTAWVLCDVYFGNGTPMPFSTRRLLRRALDDLHGVGLEFIAGLEVEFHVFKVTDARMQLGDSGQPGRPPEVELLTHGYQYLTELRYDQIDPISEILRRDIEALGLPLRSLEVELGPSQFEFTFGPQAGMGTADAMILFRSAVKQICRRHGHHATFMCRPRIPNTVSSGWHLHQSLVGLDDGRNRFMPEAAGEALSSTGLHFLGGLLAHAPASTALSTPTINGYKRYRAYSLAPDRANWGRDNRGVMLRVLGGAGDDATRIENRVGEPAANPYLYFASQVIAGLDGIRRRLDPGASADSPYDTPAARLPASLQEAVQHLRASACLREGLGQGFVDYFCAIKEAEIARYNQEVSEWEHREYFEMF